MLKKTVACTNGETSPQAAPFRNVVSWSGTTAANRCLLSKKKRPDTSPGASRSDIIIPDNAVGKFFLNAETQRRQRFSFYYIAIKSLMMRGRHDKSVILLSILYFEELIFSVFSAYSASLRFNATF